MSRSARRCWPARPEEPHDNSGKDPAVFADLDAQLPADRGHAGQPARRDFTEYELPAIREAFSTRFKSLAQPVPRRPDYTELFSSGQTVRAYAAVGRLKPSGSAPSSSAPRDRPGSAASRRAAAEVLTVLTCPPDSTDQDSMIDPGGTRRLRAAR